MVLNAVYQVSVIIFCIVATVFMLTVLIWVTMFQTQLNKLIEKIAEILEIAKITVGDTKDFVDHTITSLETFKKSVFTFDFIGRIVTEIIKLIKNNNNSKGVNNGQAD